MALTKNLRVTTITTKDVYKRQDMVRCIIDWKNQFKIGLKQLKWYTKEVINSCDDKMCIRDR